MTTQAAPVYKQDSTGKFGWIRFSGEGRGRERAFATGETDVSPLQTTPRPGCNLCRLILEHTQDRCRTERAG